MHQLNVNGKNVKKLLLCATILVSMVHAVHAAVETKKISLSLLHYNLQYVAGKSRVEKKIILESLEPVLDMYLRHPGWGVDIEMQGYMVEELYAKYPDIFKKLKTLVDREQIDLVCFHYSDQLFLAYPRKDMEWSVKINNDIFKKTGLKRSDVVFTQEGQFGEGMLSFMKDNKFSTAVLSSNLFKYFHKDEDGKFYPYYEKYGAYVVPTSGLVYEDKKTKLEVQWGEFGDAELVPTGASPYEPNFKYKPEVLKEFEDKLMKMEVEGFSLLKISEYVRQLKAMKIKPKPLPPFLDGTWQPKDTDNVFRWMGEHKTTAEKDVLVLSINVQSRFDLLAAEAMLSFAKQQKLKINFSELQGKLYGAWKLQLFAEVSDSTGWTPSPDEVKYSLENAIKAKALAEEIIGTVKKELNTPFVKINTKTMRVEKIKLLPGEPQSAGKAKMPVEYEIKANNVAYDVKSVKYDENETVIEITMKKQAPGATLTLSFHALHDTVVFSPALLEDRLTAYLFSSFTADKTFVPLSNGLLGLSDDVFIIKHNESNHVAAKIDFINKKVEWLNLNPSTSEEKWRFTIFKGTKEKALEKANTLNVFPVLFR